MSLVVESSNVAAEELAKLLQEEMSSLELEPGARIQPLRELAVRYDVSYVVARKAINILCGKGLLESRRGAGIYVLDEKSKESSGDNKFSKTIAMLFCGLEQHVTTSPIYNRLLYGIEKEAELQGYNVVISMVKSPENFHNTEIYSSSTAFLALGEDISGIKKLFADKVFVWVMGADKPWGDQVSYNNKAVGELAAKTLISRGHKHLAVVNVDPLIGKQRCDTFALYAEHGGATVDVYDDPSVFISTRFEQHIDQEVMGRWAEQIARSKPMPTGVFVVDMAAHSLYNALVDHGIIPGTDIEMMTCNCRDVPAFRANYSPLNIDIYAEEIGAIAVRHLQWRLTNHISKRVILKVEPSLDKQNLKG